MLRRWLGVWAPVPHGVEASWDMSWPVGEYMPNNVEDVRFSIDRVRLGGRELSCRVPR